MIIELAFQFPCKLNWIKAIIFGLIYFYLLICLQGFLAHSFKAYS
jgi:hypothetical protein